MALNTYARKEESFLISNPRFHRKKLEREEQINSKQAGGRLSTEINDTENGKTV